MCDPDSSPVPTSKAVFEQSFVAQVGIKLSAPVPADGMVHVHVDGSETGCPWAFSFSDDGRSWYTDPRYADEQTGAHRMSFSLLPATDSSSMSGRC